MNPIARVDQNGNILEKYVYGIRSNIPEYIIKDDSNGSLPNNIKFDEHGIPTGTTIGFNINSKDYSLAHEIWHSYASDKGITDYGKILGEGEWVPSKYGEDGYYINSELPQSEINAVEFENLARKNPRFSYDYNGKINFPINAFKQVYLKCECP